MKRKTLDDIVSKYSDTHLICDSRVPLITNSTLAEEAMLYNLEKDTLEKVVLLFSALTDKTVNLQTDTSTLSGGQKVVLMVLLALYSPARHIVFINLFAGLDDIRSDIVMKQIEKFRPLKDEIILAE